MGEKMITIKLSEAQKSAVECRDWSEEPFMRAAWDGGYRIRIDPEDATHLLSEVIDAANTEDAEQQCQRDREMAKLAGRACRALSSLADKIIYAGN